MKNPNTFHDVENPVVSAYNRAITSLSIFDEDGEEPTREYFQQFSENDRSAIAAMMIAIKRDPEATLKRVQAVISETVN